jgi:Protein of unknown function (DUF2591)
MKTVKTSELTGNQLDWAVAKCEGLNIGTASGCGIYTEEAKWFAPSTDWAQGGPIIERYRIAIDHSEGNDWCASSEVSKRPQSAATPLIAAMRCYVAAKMGDEIEIPEELT